MNRLTIGYFADGPWSHKAFEKLIIDQTIEFKFIVPRSDTKDSTLKEFAIRHDIDYLTSVNINSKEFLNTIKSYGADLFVSMSFNQIFRSSIINMPTLGVINCHAGKLPFYRGRNVLNWVLINDESEFGITVHYVDEGIDTGDIINQECFKIKDSDDYNTLLQISYVECASILYKSIKEIQNEKSRRIPQNTIHPVGFYCGKRGDGDETINWNQNSRALFNFIRSISKPGPVATTFFKGDEIKINKAKLIEHAPEYICTPGQLLAKTDQGFLVKTLDSYIEILEIDSKVILRVGDKLGK